jgi:hypothetical protein
MNGAIHVLKSWMFILEVWMFFLRWNSWTSINKRLESFAPCYSQFLLLADFKENHILLWLKKSLQKIRETRNLESIYEKHFVEWKNSGRKPDKNSSLRRIGFMPRNLD